MCWSALIVGLCIQKAPTILVGRLDVLRLLQHMILDWSASSKGVLTLLLMMSMLAIWFLVKEPGMSYNLEEDRFKLIVVGYVFLSSGGSSI